MKRHMAAKNLISALCAVLLLCALPLPCASAIGGEGISPDGRSPGRSVITYVPGMAVTSGSSASSEPLSRPSAASTELEPAEKVAAEFLRSELKLNSAAIAGILANISRESNFDPATVGDEGESFGLCQWRDRRRDRLLAYCETRSLDVTTTSAQLAFLRDELRDFYPDTLASLEGCRDSAAGAINAAVTFCKYYETPKQLYTETQARSSLASEKYYDKVSRYAGAELPVSQIQAELISADFLRNELNFNNAATAGVLANIMDESAFNPKALGDGGKAFGLCQWTGSRLESLSRFCLREGLDRESLYAQLRFIKYELENGYSFVAEKLRDCPDSAEGALAAAKIFCSGYEVPKNLGAALKLRNKYAEKAYYPMLETPLETTEFLHSMAARASDFLAGQKKGSDCPESLEEKLLDGEGIKIY